MITGPSINLLLHNHFITHKFQKKKSGGAKDSAIFAFFFLIRKRAKPAPPPYLLSLIVQHPLANCHLYYSQITVDPQKSIDYVQRNRNKKVIYRSFVTNSYTNITTGSSFNALVNSGIVHPVQIENMNTCAYKPTCTCTYTCMHIYRHTCKPLVYIFYQNLHKYKSTYIHLYTHVHMHM